MTTGFTRKPHAGGVGATARVDLFWIPLGAGASVPVVRWNGLLFEAVAAWRHRRRRSDLYHAALQVHLGDSRYVVELAPAWGAGHAAHGVVLLGPVGLRWLGRSRYFRYEVRRWRDGIIPDIGWAVGGPRCVTDDESRARRVLELVAAFPTATWGRDELGTGDMWNSNSLIAWTLASAGVDAAHLAPPAGGRAPGWSAGLVVAARQHEMIGPDV